jgi:hypothetical protein
MNELEPARHDPALVGSTVAVPVAQQQHVPLVLTRQVDGAILIDRHHPRVATRRGKDVHLEPDRHVERLQQALDEGQPPRFVEDVGRFRKARRLLVLPRFERCRPEGGARQQSDQACLQCIAPHGQCLQWWGGTHVVNCLL